MTAKEIYEEYCGCIVEDCGYVGEVIGYWNKNCPTNILIGIRRGNGEQGWWKNDINSYDKSATVPIYIPNNKFDSYRFINGSTMHLISGERKSSRLITIIIQEKADNWLRNLKTFNDIDEETANILLNAFMAGAKEIERYKQI